MPTNKQLRGRGVEDLSDTRVVSSRVASDMGHQDVDSRKGKPKVFAVVSPNLRIVDVSKHASKGLEGGELVGDRELAEIAGVPDFVTILKSLKDQRVEESMGVRNQPDFHSIASLSL